MVDIQFDEEQEFSQSIRAPRQSTFVRFVLKTGLAKTEKAAEYVLLGVAAFAFIAIVFIVFGHTNTPQQTGSTESAALKAEREASLHR